MDFQNIPPTHFLIQQRPDPRAPHPPGFVDTTTLAAHDFDVDTRTGFMPPQPPLSRLPSLWEIWEVVLDSAMTQKLKLAERVEQTDGNIELKKSEQWRQSVQHMPILPTDQLKTSERALRRAHHVLGWILHFYAHTTPSTASQIIIPRSVTIPLLQVSVELQLPPVLTYSDEVLYNWNHRNPPLDESELANLPKIDNLRCQTTFTGTTDEEEFYLVSARIELRGVEVLELMRLTMDEAFVGDDIAISRITSYLDRMGVVIDELRELLLSVKEGVDPEVFYNEIRPWLRGADGDTWGRKWIWEGLEEIGGPDLLDNISGASAGQSSLVHALDIFLGIDHQNPHTSSPSTTSSKTAFQTRMRAYMPRHHRAFLDHLSANTRPIRALVQKIIAGQGVDSPMVKSYNTVVKSLKRFRDAHMIVVTLYVIGPARRAEKARAAAGEKNGLVASSSSYGALQQLVEGDIKLQQARKNDDEKKGLGMMERAFSSENGDDHKPLKGTGGTDLVRFLKGVRDNTTGAYLG